MYGIIYKATNKINDNIYIGQTTQKLSYRVNNHKLKSQHFSNRYFYNSLNKYGFHNFEWEEIDCAEFDKEELDYLEKYWIKFYNSNNKKYGYNLTDGGFSGNKGYKHSEKAKKKMSASKKGHTPWNKGLTKNTNKSMQNISEKHKGKTYTKETRKKMSESKKGKSTWNKGIKMSFVSPKKIILDKTLVENKYYEFNESLIALYTFFGVSKPTMRKILKEYNIKSKKPEIDINDVILMLFNKESMQNIADKYQTTISTIYNRLKEIDIYSKDIGKVNSKKRKEFINNNDLNNLLKGIK